MRQGLVSAQNFSKLSIDNLAGRAPPEQILLQFWWEPKISVVTETMTCGGKEKVWKTVRMNFSCLCYLKIRRRFHITWTVGFLCTTECLEGLSSSRDQFRPSSGPVQDQFGPSLGWTETKLRFSAHTPTPLQDLGTELPSLSHPRGAKLIFLSLDYYFLFQIKENRNERERKRVTHGSLSAETQLPLSQEQDS